MTGSRDRRQSSATADCGHPDVGEGLYQRPPGAVFAHHQVVAGLLVEDIVGATMELRPWGVEMLSDRPSCGSPADLRRPKWRDRVLALPPR